MVSRSIRWPPSFVHEVLLHQSTSTPSGWYANTEVVRDLTDESRYNLLEPCGKALGFDTDTQPGDAPLWIDMVMSILSMAVVSTPPVFRPCHALRHPRAQYVLFTL